MSGSVHMACTLRKNLVHMNPHESKTNHSKIIVYLRSPLTASFGSLRCSIYSFTWIYYFYVLLLPYWNLLWELTSQMNRMSSEFSPYWFPITTTTRKERTKHDAPNLVFVAFIFVSFPWILATFQIHACSFCPRPWSIKSGRRKWVQWTDYNLQFHQSWENSNIAGNRNKKEQK